MTAATEYQYIIREPSILGGEPVIVGTRTPVRAVVELWRLGIAPESIPDHLPHISQAQVFAALSYFSDHQPEISAFIDRNKIVGKDIATAVKRK